MTSTFTGFSADHGQLNAAVYPPGERCLAMDGCPTNPQCWSVVTWFPGKETLMRCFGTHADALAFIHKALNLEGLKPELNPLFLPGIGATKTCRHDEC